MTIKQLSVFLENREGRLDEVLNTLGSNGVNIVALSLADTADYGMLRMIVSEPQKGKAVLKEAGITAMLTDVVALRVPHATGSLSKAMHEIVAAGINVEYMYAFANGSDASAVLKSDNPAKVVEVLNHEGAGHTFAMHAQDRNVVEKFAKKVPVSRFLVNAPAALGGIGAATNLFPALTLGCGAVGGSSSSNNIGPMDLVNIRRVAWGTENGQEQVQVSSDLVEVLAQKILERLK